MVWLRQLQPGELFQGKYRVLESVGRGSMGVVYAVASIDNGEKLALKLLGTEHEDEKSGRRFEREVNAGKDIDSPHIAKVLDAGTEDGRRWLVMEYVEGVPLAAFVEAESTSEQKRGVCLQLLSALAAAHRIGVVHRDLKPENVFVARTPDGKPLVKVLDFGIAKSLMSTTAHDTRHDLGAPLWMAPEQINQAPPSRRGDVWGLGLLSFLVFTGKCYWISAGPGGSLAELAVELLNSPIEQASDRAQKLGRPGTLPEGFDAWFARSVCRDPGERFRDASEAQAAFIRLFDRRGSTRHKYWMPVYTDALPNGAISHDASDQGMLLVADRSLPVDTRLELRFNTPPQPDREFRVSARVIRAMNNDEDPFGLWPYKIAVEFEEPVMGLNELLGELESPARG